jgi:mRNA interferase MazF
MFFALLDPAKGSEQAGSRPVIIISRDAINQNSSVVICVPCTNARNCSRIYPSQLLLRKGIGGLTVDSVAMCEQVRAITKDRLGRHLGKLDPHSLRALEERIRIALDFS